ncbi:BapA/Bap/LapF family large adhesin [Acinetobacter indicus]|uniref:BapA/Bap/LapF family large adhesin n=1 Tax=Acinetobacter indicus TaxID=756892 RepID=UPI002E34EAF3|nr:BapA/Bap/LapF family large adhesin [Acinetobacter indicus]
MPNIAVTSKETQQLLLSADTNTVTLSENSVVKIDTAIEDVASITREGNAAIVNLKNGEKVVIESYFDDPLDSHHIVFDNGEQLYWAEFANAAGEILPTIKYHFIETISPLLYADTLAALMPWVTGAVAAGATIAAVGSDSDSASSNTPVDSTAAEQLVIAAEEAQQAAEDLLNQAQEDGLITSEEQAQLQDAADAAAEAKDTAQDAVTALPESADTEELQDRLDAINDPITVPPVNDADGNGIDDAFEAAEALVTDAENAHQAAEDVIAGAQEDGLISPAEQQAIQDAVDAATEAEQTAQDAVTALPESTDKDGLQDRLDALTDLEVPAVNDQDGNGIDDATDSLIADAEAAVAAAEAAYAEAEQAIADADTDGNGLITPAEQAVAQAAIDEAAELKAIAQNAVTALPAEVQAEKDGLQERVDALTELLAPVVTDADGDGVIDDLNGLIASAEAAVAAAETAYATAQQAIADADTDGNGLITPAEQAVAQAAIDEAAKLKAIAQNAVNALPAEVQVEKDGLQGRLDDLIPLTAPAVTDADGNGIDDAFEAAEALVTDAENAHQAAEDVIAGAQEDGLISPAEQQAIQDAVDAATEAEQTAQDAVTALPESTDKDGLQDRLDALTDLEVPAVNDQDGNGIDDATDSLIADAEAAVAAAEAAYAEAEQAIADADTDGNGLITPAEQAVAQAAIDEAAELKAIAQNAVTALPAEVQAEKDGLQERVDALTELLAPVVTDADGDGVIDDLNGLIASAEAAVAAAETAYATAQQAIADADTDGNGLITPAEQAVAQAAIDEAAKLKAIAQNAVNALPAEVQVEKDGLQGRLDDLIPLTAPAVTDADGNGIDDAFEAAEALVTDAENAHQAAEDVIAGAQEDGLISPAEQQAIQDAVDAATEAEQTAQDAVTALPESTDKDGLQDRLDALTDLEVPAVNDQDGNGIDDATDSLIADAEAAVAAAEAAYAEAKQAIADADTDGNGLITPAEQAVAQAAIDEAAELKAIAQNAVTALPAEVQAEKDGLQERVDALTELLAPVVTDADGNGIDDAVDAAEAAVKAAEEAYADAQTAISNADTDGNGVITAAEQQAVQDAIDTAAGLKSTAEDLVDALAAGPVQDGLNGRLDALTPLTAPAVTDADGNGIDDAVDAAEAAVKAAEEAYADAQTAISNADTDGNGVITAAEQQAVQDAIDTAAGLKSTAEDLVDALAAGPVQDGLNGRLDALTPLTAPAVTDADGNGIDDAVDAAEAAVKAAEEAYADAQTAISNADTDGNGVITAAEQQAVQDAIDTAAGLKSTAEDLVDALAAGPVQDGLNGRLDALTPLTAPAVTDADGNGIDDAVDAAEAAVKAAEEAYADAQTAISNADTDGNGVITAAEQQAVQDAIDTAAGLKSTAEDLVDALAAGPVQDGLNGRLDALTPLTAPAVTDADGNGIDDAVDAAEAAVKAAEEAYADAQTAISNADTDGNGVITAAEQQAVQDAIDTAAGLKSTAEDLVDALAAGPVQDGLNGRLDALTPLTAPAVTDADAIDDEYVLDMGQEALIERDAESYNDVTYIDLLGGTTGQILGANFSIPQDPNDVGQAHTGNITITASQQDLLSVAEAFQLIVYQNVDGVQTEVARIGNQGGVVTLGGVGILGIVNNPDGISVTLSDLPEGEYTAVVAKDSSLLSDLIYGIELDKLGGEEAILGASNEQAIYDAINAVLTPELAAPLVTLVQAILVPVNTIGLPISSVVSQLLEVLPVEVIDELINQVVAPLVTNTLTLYENTDITIDGTEETFPTYTLSSNVFEDNGNGVDVTPVGTIISEIDGVSVSGIEIIQGDYGVLEINTVTGAFTYKVTSGEEALGKTEIFNYTIQNGTQTDTAQIIIDISGTAFDDGTLLPPDYVDQVVANDDLATVQNYYEEPGDDIGNTGGAGQLLGVELVGIPISIGSTTPFNFDVLENQTSDVEIAVSGFKSTTLSASLLTTLADILTGNILYADAVLQRQYLDENGVAQTENFVVESGIALDAGLSLADLSFGYTYSGLINYEDLPEGIYTLSIQPQETEGELRALIDALGSVVAVDLFGGINFTITDQTNKYLGSNEIEGNVISSTDGTDLVNSTTYVKFVSNELGDPDVAIDNGNTVVEGAYGTLYISPNGAYKYVSNGDLADIGKVDTFTYTIRDFNGSEDTAQLNIRIDGEGLITWPSDPTEVGADQAVVVTATNDVGDVATTLLYNPATTVAATFSTTGLTNITSTAAVTKSMTFDVGPNDGATSVSTSVTISETSTLASASANVVATLKDSLGNIIATLPSQFVTTSTLNILDTPTATANFSNLVLNSGTYTIEYSFSDLSGSAYPVTLTASPVTMNKIDLDSYQAVNSAELTETGNIFTDGTADILANKFTTLTIGTQTLTQSSGDVVITGTYGNLTISGDGEYSYQANTANYGGVETFNYTLTSLSGETSTANLTIGVGRDFTSTAFNDVITTNSNGGDTVIYNLLNSASNSGGNGTDTWTDFNATEGDSIDISALLGEQSVTSETLGNFVTLEQRGEHTVVTIDRDGSATDTTYAKTDLIILENTTASNLVLDDLIKYNQI